jgi:hypothetical protein
MEVATAAKITVALDDDLDSSPADETVRSGIGGTDYVIDPSDHGRIPASIVQRHQAATGGRCRRAWRIADPNQSRRPVSDAR